MLFELGAENIDNVQLGGKAKNLNKLIRTGYPVPGGVVLSDLFFKQHLPSDDLKYMLSDANFSTDTDLLLKKIKAKILTAVVPASIIHDVKIVLEKSGIDRCAVRSSANLEDDSDASFAGIFKTLLNVPLHKLDVAIKEVWASVFEKHVLAYLQDRSFDFSEIRMAVIIQKMLNPEISGVCFSINPVTGNPSETVMEAVWGLGETLVSSAVTPDTYIVQKDLDIKISTFLNEQEFALINSPDGVERLTLSEENSLKRKMNDDQIIQVWEIAKHLQNDEGYPVDIEFVIEKNQLYIVQVRPITTIH